MKRMLLCFSIIVLGAIVFAEDNPILLLAKRCEINNVYTKKLVSLKNGEELGTAVYIPLTKEQAQKIDNVIGNPSGILVITPNSTSIAFSIKSISFSNCFDGSCFVVDSTLLVMPSTCKNFTLMSFHQKSIILYVWSKPTALFKTDMKVYSFFFSTSDFNAFWNIVEKPTNKEYSKFLLLSKP